jgi:methionine-S-sulfoxide reductase
VQGLLGAPLVPLAMSMLLGGGDGDGHGGADRQIPTAAGLLFFLAPALGPSAGGLLIAAGGWQWIFLINLPIGLTGLLGVRRIPASAAPGPRPGARFDPLGLALLAAGLTVLLLGADRATAQGWTALPAALPAVAGAVLLAGYVARALRHPHPAVDLTLLRRAQPALSLGLSVLSSVVTFGAVFLLPVFTQTVQHHTPPATGLTLLPQGVITGLSTALGRRLSARYGVRTLATTGFAILAVTSSGLLLLRADTPLWLTATILSGRAAAIGLVITPLLSAMLAPLPADRLTDANTVFNIAQRIGGSLGVGLLGSLLAARSPLIGPVPAFHQVGLVLTITAVAAAVMSTRLTPRAPAPSAPAPARDRRSVSSGTMAGELEERAVSTEAGATGAEKAILAGGCFWGVQDLIRKQDGVLSTRVGYTGGDVANATYRNHRGHAEALEIVYDPARITYRDLLEFFFQIHDPSTRNRQGNDAGDSYRSAIFYTSQEQKQAAEDTIADVDASGLWPGKVVTEVTAAGPFWQAEPEHQDYLERYPDGYTCHYVRPNWKLPHRAENPAR